MRSLTLKSPAKVNLYLKVVGRRGHYHTIVSLFHRISFADVLHFRKRQSGFSLRVEGAKLPTDERNLITRAHQLLKEKFPSLGGVAMTVRKKIPLGAGLGGGSGNAATFLTGMKKLYRLKISEREMLKMGRGLGADVPFFLAQVNQAICRGIGDRVQKAPIRRKCWFVLLLSSQGLPTRKVYQNLSGKRVWPSLTKIGQTVKLISLFLEKGDCSQISQWLRNDLEEPAFRMRPSLGKMLDNFGKLGVASARMSGSGPTVFAVLANQKEARRIAEQYRRNFLRQGSRKKSTYAIFVCHTF